jgi:hypothetical protein
MPKMPENRKIRLLPENTGIEVITWHFLLFTGVWCSGWALE